jgi:hypothetical protein
VTFRDWLRLHESRNLPIGDLACDVSRDDRFPGGVAELSVLIEYLQCRGACDAAIQTARYAWRRFLKEQRAA